MQRAGAGEGHTETFDVLNCRGEKTGEVISRDEAHATGAWHGAFHCLIIFERDKRAHVLFQKRSSQKKIAPGKFDVSVGGHYASGEDAMIAGPREIGEELGLGVRFKELVPLGRRVFVYCFSPGVMEYEFQDVYLLQRDIHAGALILQKEEVAGVIEMDVDQGISLFSGSIASLALSLTRTDGSREAITASTDDFVPCLDRYYLKLLLLARRYVSGERELLLI